MYCELRCSKRCPTPDRRGAPRAPDGTISLESYGDVHVAGLTLPEVKKAIVLHLRKYLTDDILGLVEMDDTDEESLARPPPPGAPLPGGEEAGKGNPFDDTAPGVTRPRPEIPALPGGNPFGDTAPGVTRPRPEIPALPGGNPFDDTAPGVTRPRPEIPAPPRGEEAGKGNPFDDPAPVATRGTERPSPPVPPLAGVEGGGKDSPLYDPAPLLTGSPDGPVPPPPVAPLRADGAPARLSLVEPEDSDRVFVDVAAHNSKEYYIQGAVNAPGRLRVTGNERILDAIDFCNGLTPEADHDQVFLYRRPSHGGPVQTLKIDIDQIMMGDDLSTNYQLVAGDKLVVRRRGRDARAREKPVSQSSAPVSEPAPASDSSHSSEKLRAATENPAIRRLEKRMDEMERKLDLILESLNRPGH